MFTVGQEVFSANYGKGVVTRIIEEALFYPVEVTFHDGYAEEFTQGGKEFISEDQPSLVKTKDSNMIEFYVGQKVHCKRNGDGDVTATSDACKDYPIEVRFADGHYESYTLEGKLFENSPETHLTPRQASKPLFTVGQRVWCAILGEGVVAETTHGVYPVKVRYENGEVESYTSEGHWVVRHGNRTLFHHPVKIVQEEITTKPSIDWTHVKGVYKWLSVDQDGSAYVYEDEPELSKSDYWYSRNGSLSEVNGLASYVPGTCDWEDSLVKRPEGETP